jgi:hypothetical protein
MEQVLVIVVALLLLLGETSIYQYLGESLCQVPVNTQSLWNAARKALDLNMRSPHYIVRRMQAVKQGRCQPLSEKEKTLLFVLFGAKGSPQGVLELRVQACEALMRDITYQYAKRGSMAAACIWKWILLTLAESHIAA